MDDSRRTDVAAPTAATRAAALAWGEAWLFVRRTARESGVRGALPQIDEQVQGKRGIAVVNGIAKLGCQMRETKIPLDMAEEVAATMAREIVREQYARVVPVRSA